MTVLMVQSPGPFTTVQDLGRFGYQHMGVPVSGALDLFAARVGNHLVGNNTDAAVLEITFMGPSFEVRAVADIALTGAEMGMTLNGQPVANWASHRVNPGDVLGVGMIQKGCRAYLAVTGGFDVPPVMGSRSTYASGKVGGFDGRRLHAGDHLKCNPGKLLETPRHLPEESIPTYSPDIVLRAIQGPQENVFTESLDLFFSSVYEVTPDANRMGYRLGGPELHRDPAQPLSIVSEPSMPGNVQVPADGQPIILLVEQTVGGYAKIATVISSDIGRVAQAKPGDRIRFEQVSLERAHALFRRYRQETEGIEARLTG